MATELLAKANAWRAGPAAATHKALVSFLRTLLTNPQARARLGFAGRNENWASMIRKPIPAAEALQNMAPNLAGDGPNPEYPWPRNAPTTAPVHYSFPVWKQLTQTHDGRQLLSLFDYLFATADEFM